MANGEASGDMFVPPEEPMINEVDWRTKGVVTGVKNQVRKGSGFTGYLAWSSIARLCTQMGFGECTRKIIEA